MTEEASSFNRVLCKSRVEQIVDLLNEINEYSLFIRVLRATTYNPQLYNLKDVSSHPQLQVPHEDSYFKIANPGEVSQSKSSSKVIMRSVVIISMSISLK